MVRSSSKGGGRGSKRSLSHFALAQTLQISRPGRALCLLLSNTEPAHIKPTQTVVPGWIAWRKSKLLPSSYMSNSPAGCANRRMLLEDQLLLSKTAAKLCWQNTSSCRPTSHLHGRALLAQLHRQSLCSALHKITTHLSPRESVRALDIIAIKKKKRANLVK